MRGRESLRIHDLTARCSSAHFFYTVPGGESLLSVDRGRLGYDNCRSTSGTCCDEQACRGGNVQTMVHVNGIIARKESWVSESPDAGKGRIVRRGGLRGLDLRNCGILDRARRPGMSGLDRTAGRGS